MPPNTTPPQPPPGAPTPPPTSPPPSSSTPPTSGGKKILIVEDEAFIADLYSRQLIKAGLNVKVANDGTTGLQLLSAETFDLLLLDIMLPGINGLELLKQWRTKNQQSPMIVLLLTNLGQDAVIKEGFDLGAQGYLIKAAYTPDQVLGEVQKALDGKPPTLSTAATITTQN